MRTSVKNYENKKLINYIDSIEENTQLKLDVVEEINKINICYESKFYVYIYLDPRKPGKWFYRGIEFDYEPIYVGKGSGHRYKEHLSYIKSKSFNENSFLKRKIQNIYKESGKEPLVIKLYENITQDCSFELEKFLIKQIGRYNQKRGPLCNLTDGGEGEAGRIVSEETRIIQSESAKKKKPPLPESIAKGLETKRRNKENGCITKPWSEESKRKQSERMKGKPRTQESILKGLETKHLNQEKNGYINPRKGIKRKQESIDKREATKKERKEAGLYKDSYIYVKPPESRLKMSIAKKGKKQNPEHSAKRIKKSLETGAFNRQIKKFLIIQQIPQIYSSFT